MPNIVVAPLYVRRPAHHDDIWIGRPNGRIPALLRTVNIVFAKPYAYRLGRYEETIWVGRPTARPFVLKFKTANPSFFVDADTFYSPGFSLAIPANLVVDPDNIFPPQALVLVAATYQTLKNEVRRTLFLAGPPR